MPPDPGRRRRGLVADRTGRDAEGVARAALTEEGWTVLAERVRTPAGELDLVAEKDGLLAFIEVKARPSLYEAAFALAPRQQARLMAAAEAWMATHPDHGAAGVRFDLLLVAADGVCRRITDVLRQG
ncbi:YraN family protein [Roseococcus sp. SYP-B2431]|uniref:YraN family protein n=1 Tax=Roseococcus sp. SYP-B2431 TaxID=2496640 RepID=UPI00103B720A|nr:YraN family protein [Roseococcus sp. SYP-B2431]TCH97099.1 YraN family protein [Roseococcus sp. SYP-B2431]